MTDRNVGGRIVPKSEGGTQASQEVSRRESNERKKAQPPGGCILVFVLAATCLGLATFVTNLLAATTIQQNTIKESAFTYFQRWQ